MAVIKVTETAQSYGDGTKILHITGSGNYKYGYGASEPTTWHTTKDGRDAYIFAADFGKIWFKSISAYESPLLAITEGV